ncbi:two-component system response regulator [candidate division WOR-3 bacterium]|uniref:Two-component system response regulator n=1 Tax=candidate division WOR-3 bacterium TaxID=2052148 RepID=A0A660SKF2_UNCW3|nr:MAG: two-component system response regulator [candidate division WOR-3 bacterium]
MKILIVEDERRFAQLIGEELKELGYKVCLVGDGTQALKEMEASPYEIVLTDIRMAPMDGVELLKRMKEKWPETEVVMMTAYASVETAVEALRHGAFDYLIKPFDFEELRLTIERIVEKLRLKRERDELKSEIEAGQELIYRSQKMAEVVRMATEVAKSDTPVLVLGESGTGKELVARLIHKNSPRKARPFLPIHCAAIPETLLESELFGYERGAFTGANRPKPGKFEVAEGGTVFLDEVGEIPPSIQVKLLRVLQEKRISRLGSTDEVAIDVRIISATNKDLEEEIEKGHFRDDLYYRISVFPILIPPLRERPEDIPPLVTHILKRLRFPHGVDDEAMADLLSYPWPGNVRELENVLERATILARGRIRREHLNLRSTSKGLYEMEREMIIDALKKAGGNKAKAARLLGITRRTLYSRMEKYGLR